ncbi:MAG: hypothetical protein AAFN18_22770 [Cyanobacteria bacterium J06554_6]
MPKRIAKKSRRCSQGEKVNPTQFFEISDHTGDHAVVEVPKKKASFVSKLLGGLGVRNAEADERLCPHVRRRRADQNPNELTYTTAPEFDASEDLEDNHDQENDRSDWEYTDVPVDQLIAEGKIDDEASYWFLR